MPQPFHIPVMYPDGCRNFPKALKSRLDEYHTHLKNIGCNHDIITKAQRFSENMLTSLDKYFEGRVHDAYTIFRNALRDNVNEIKLEFINTSAEKVLYRARLEEPKQEDEFDKEDLFHIKFECRTKVKNQRFSISGLPCLYMSESLFACWLEMGRPSMDIFTAASINIENEIKSFDLCKMYDILTSDNKEEQIKYANFIHLIIATSFSVLDKSGEFKPEYIIPQFIMQWLRDNDYGISGVKYYCTFRTPNLENKRLFINYAFPTQKITDTGFCKTLEENFTIKRVMPGRHVQYYNKNASTIFYGSGQQSNEFFEISAGLKRTYRDSMFGIFEKLLDSDLESADGGVICFRANNPPATPTT